MGRFWYLETFDYMDPGGFRHIGFIPQGVIWPKMTISVKGLSVWRLMEKIERFDRTVKCPFGWFFYAVHGNRIGWAETKAIAEAVRSGKIHFEPRDERVLLAWDNDPYGF
jgi:hypothetical protein